MQTMHDSSMRAKPSAAWNPSAELREKHRGASHAPGASLSGRRQRVWITRAFSPGYNMTGLRPCRTGVDTVVGKVVRSGQRWVGMRVFTALSGKEAGKWCSFSHLETALTRLFPHKSTQVVDFPHLAHVRLFWEGAEDSRMSGRGMIGRGIGRKPNGAWKSFRTGTVGRLN